MSAYALPGAFSFLNRKQEEAQQDEPKQSRASELLVTIQSVTIDPLKYIQFFKTSASFHPAAITKKTTEPQVDNSSMEEKKNGYLTYLDQTEEEYEDDDYYNYSDTSYPEQSSSSIPAPTIHEDKNSCSAVPDAVHFHLSISFYGRSYTAKRTLPSFEQLRNDLIQEICPMTYPEISIPELPKNMFSQLMDTIVGLSNIQAAMTSCVCPAMESWLRTVAQQLPGSPSLCKFLWEPLSYVSSTTTTKTTTKTTKTTKTTTKTKSTNIHRKASKSCIRKHLNNCSLSSIDEAVRDEEDESQDE